MLKVKVSIGTYREKSNADRITYVKECTAKMAANPATASPDEPYAPITALAVAANTNYEVWVAVPTPSNKVAYLDTLKEMDTKFVTNMNYCSRVANGNIALIIALGLTPTPSSYGTISVPKQVEGVEIKVPNKATNLIINSKNDRAARGIITILTSDPHLSIVFDNNLWRTSPSMQNADTQIVVSTGTRINVAGLQSDVRYYVQRFAFNQAGYGGISVKVSAVVQ